ncbi:MAG TPA: alkaline phosphatase family protein [Nitrososphaerales archaeon]|nr:alkaline phosphatase family protein [Nitrososphaerales archaeon]
MQPHKLIIIGLDAADLQLTQEFMKDGDMPRLSAIADQGCFSRLKSGVPPQTAPAWTSITTGVNPGKHGIYYFYNFSTSPITIVNATNTSTPRIWDYVEALDGRSVVVNVPITYPVHEIAGSIVSGIPPWYLDERSVYPKELMGRLKSARYEIDAPMSRGLEKNPDALVDRVLTTEERRVSLFLNLLKEGEWSFGMVVLTGLDRLQHKLLGKGERESKAVRRGYSGVDALVGKVIDALGGDANFLIVSDHGFNPRPLAFYPNSWLYSEGMLLRKSSLRYRLTRMAHNILDGHLLWLPQSVTKRFQGATTVIRTIDAVDLERSRAFVPGTDGVIVVKSKEDEERIVSGLSALKDAEGREICKVYARDQVYKGERLDAAPELLILPREDINIKTDPFSRSVISSSGSFPKANHGPNGIFLATGPDIRRSGALDASLEDVAPTSLTLMGVRPPDSMDGHAIDEIMREQRSPQSLRPTDVMKDDRTYAFSEKEEKQVMDNLKRLGYT